MKYNSTETKKNILNSAKNEFCKHGFDKASLRTIATNASVTTGALYKHFKNKDAIFCALVSPIYEELIKRYNAASDKFFKHLKKNGLDYQWKSETKTIEEIIKFMYEHFDIFKLLITGAKHSSYEDFGHSIIDLEVKTTKKYFNLAKKYGYTKRCVTDKELHIFINAQFSCILEMILHNIPKNTALKLSKEIILFFKAGWYALLME
ncbi:TetR family transcriptional regulator [Fusobacterium sp. PH5-44]|uniref:TetR family transcriptional regulator n=1 Tax=unclassified Fusobacterium TaxID=2648384 RepID=UPI003D1AA68D